VVVSQGEIWWADLPEPTGFGPGFRRPVAVVQCDALNQSRLATVICVPLTSNLKWALAPGNANLSARVTGLPKDSVANVSQIVSLDKGLLNTRVSKLPPPQTSYAGFRNRPCPGQVAPSQEESGPPGHGAPVRIHPTRRAVFVRQRYNELGNGSF
jgi:mRNA interferase MazF